MSVDIYANECTGEIAYRQSQSDETKAISDNVNHPSHYNQYPVEVIESMKNLCTHEEFVGYLKCNIIKYLARYPYKNEVEDLQKLESYRKQLEEFEYGGEE